MRGVEHHAHGSRLQRTMQTGPIQLEGARAVAPSAGPLGAFYLVSFGALGVYAPYFPLWLEAHGFTGVAMSAIAAVSPAMSFVGPPLAGAWSDARGARGNLLTLVCAVASLSMLALSAAEAAGLSHSFAIVLGAVLCYAACRSPVIMLADRIALEHGGNYGRRRVWGSVGFLLAATLCGRWFPEPSWRWIPLVLAALMAASALASLRLPRSTSSVRARSSRAVSSTSDRRRFVAFLLCSALFSASHSSMDLCASLFFRDLGATGAEIGMLWATGVIAEILLMTSAGGALTLRSETLLVLAYTGGALRWLLTSSLPGPAWAFLTQPLHAVSFGLVWLTSIEHIRRTSSPETFGTAQGVFMAANATGGVLGMLVWGPLYETRGGQTVFLWATALGATAAVLAFVWLHRAPAASAPSHGA